MRELLMTLLPLLGIIGLGIFGRKFSILNEYGVNNFKDLIVKMILPGVLFASFSHTELGWKAMISALIMLVLCFLLYFYGQGMRKILDHYMPFERAGYFMTGFEFGMLGVGLLSAIWGVDVLPYVMPLALGHEIFIWFFYAPRLDDMDLRDGHRKKITWLGILKQFVRTPTAIGILAGVLVNVTGIVPWLETSLFGGIIYTVIDTMTPAVGPMILLYIGFSLKAKGLPPRDVIIYSMVRWVGVIIAVIAGVTLFKALPYELDALYYAAFVGFLILPPPYIIPLFVQNKKAKEFYTQLLLINTMISFIGYGLALYLL